MKQLKCLYCNKVWYVDDIELETVNTCPFCSTTIRHKASIGNIDTLGKALYSAILVEGPESFLNREKMSGYLLDVIPNLKKEIRIFTNMFNDDYIALYRSAFHQNDGESIITINKIKSQLIDEEGLSEAWADTLCQSCLEAVSYYKGKGLSDSLDADVNDYKDEIKTRPEQINEPDSSLSVNKPSIILNSGKTEIKNNAGWSITYRIGRGIRFGRHKNGDPILNNLSMTKMKLLIGVNVHYGNGLITIFLLSTLQVKNKSIYSRHVLKQRESLLRIRFFA